MKAMTLPLACALAALALGATAQAPSSPPVQRDQSIVTAEAPPTAAQTRNAADLEFLAEALRTSLAEIRMGRLAAERGLDPRVRDYGALLERDHTQHAEELKRQLTPLGVTIPEEPSAEALSQQAALARLPAEEFDAAFVQTMIWAHTEAIEEYGAKTHANPNRALSDLASQSLPMLREHLAAAEALR